MSYVNAIPALQGLVAQTPLNENPLHLAANVYGAFRNMGATALPAGPKESKFQREMGEGLVKAVAVNAVMGALVLGTAGHLLPYFDVKSGAKWGALLGAGQALFTRMTS
ncbi:MAG: hypothetical protein KAJ42_00490 [Gemmatimonadetes bacterium]|nr:hypothetical protein [Gemmatimonadota bacterium]